MKLNNFTDSGTKMGPMRCIFVCLGCIYRVFREKNQRILHRQKFAANWSFKKKVRHARWGMGWSGLGKKTQYFLKTLLYVRHLRKVLPVCDVVYSLKLHNWKMLVVEISLRGNKCVLSINLPVCSSAYAYLNLSLMVALSICLSCLHLKQNTGKNKRTST